MSKFETLQINLLCDENAGMLTLPKVALESLAQEPYQDDTVAILAFGAHTQMDFGAVEYDRIFAYDTKTNQWWMRGKIPFDLLHDKLQFGATATQLNDGRVLVCSNYDDASHRDIIFDRHLTAIKPQSFIFNPYGPPDADDVLPYEKLSEYDSREFACRSHSSLVTLHSGRVLRVGGLLKQIYQNDGIAEFDPATKKWQLVVENKMPADACCVVLANGWVLISGGRYQMNRPQKECMLYDPDSRIFIQTGSMNVARRRHGGCLLRTGDVFVFGGMEANAAASCERYSVATGTWSLLNERVDSGNEFCFLLPDGRIFTAGGYSPGCRFFDIEKDTIRIAPRMPHTMMHPTMVGLKDPQFM
jgi:hypothetical protein